MAGRTKHQELLCHQLSSQLQSQVHRPLTTHNSDAGAPSQNLHKIPARSGISNARGSAEDGGLGVDIMQ